MVRRNRGSDCVNRDATASHRENGYAGINPQNRIVKFMHDENVANANAPPLQRRQSSLRQIAGGTQAETVAIAIACRNLALRMIRLR